MSREILIIFPKLPQNLEHRLATITQIGWSNVWIAQSAEITSYQNLLFKFHNNFAIRDQKILAINHW